MSYDNFPIAVVDNGGQWTHREYRVLNYLGCRAEIISNVTPIEELDRFQALVLSGGAPRIESESEALGLTSEYLDLEKWPILGICVGLQMFADVGYEETETKGLGWISGKVSKINNQNGKFKLPHIGWNEINIVKDSKIFNNIEDKSHMYFVHSYEFIPEDKSIIAATTDYSSKVVCAVEKENIFGTQFHPEKSDKIGLRIIENFIAL